MGVTSTSRVFAGGWLDVQHHLLAGLAAQQRALVGDAEHALAVDADESTSPSLTRDSGRASGGAWSGRSGSCR